MKSIKIYCSIFLSILIFISCQKDIEFNGKITDPLVVVNSYITPDSVVSAHVSESRFFLKDSITYRNIDNAEVAVWVNGILKEKLNPTTNGNYIGTYKPNIGETVKLIVNVPSMNEVSCETKIYPHPVINSIDTVGVWYPMEYEIARSGYSNGGPTIWTNDTIGTYTHQTMNYTLKFNDNANEQNYYRLIVKTTEYITITDPILHTTRDTTYSHYYFNFSDVVSGNTNNDPSTLLSSGSYINNYAVFSDELFNGKTYSLTFSTDKMIYNFISSEYSGKKNPDKYKINIYLQSISRDYYLYLKTRVASSGDNFFSEPVQVHNNIKGGIGIFGSYTSSNVVSFDLY